MCVISVLLFFIFPSSVTIHHKSHHSRSNEILKSAITLFTAMTKKRQANFPQLTNSNAVGHKCRSLDIHVAEVKRAKFISRYVAQLMSKSEEERDEAYRIAFDRLGASENVAHDSLLVLRAAVKRNAIDLVKRFLADARFHPDAIADTDVFKVKFDDDKHSYRYLTPLGFAVRHDRSQIVRCFLDDSRVRVQAYSRKPKRSSLQCPLEGDAPDLVSLACEANSGGALAELLKDDNRFDVTWTGRWNRNYLHMCIEIYCKRNIFDHSKGFAALEVLLANPDLDVNITNRQNYMTPLFLAMEANNFDMVRRLLARKDLDISATSEIDFLLAEDGLEEMYPLEYVAKCTNSCSIMFEKSINVAKINFQ